MSLTNTKQHLIEKTAKKYELEERLLGDYLNQLAFHDTYLTKKQFLQALKFCNTGVSPDIAVEAVTGDQLTYLILLNFNKHLKNNENSKHIQILTAAYKYALASLVSKVYTTAMSSDTKNALAAAKILLELEVQVRESTAYFRKEVRM